MKKFIFALIMIGFGAMFADAQLITDDEDIQSWNDIQLTVPMNKAFDFYTAITMRFGKNVTRLNDGRYAIGFAWKPTKTLSIMPFYWNIQARNQRSQFKQEHRLAVRITYRFPFKSFGLTNRSQFEKRMRPPANSWRYRSMFTFEKNLPKTLIPAAKFFIADEFFYDSATGKWSRNRFSAGISKTLSKKLSVDVSYMRQNDGYSHPGDLNTIWAAWRVKL